MILHLATNTMIISRMTVVAGTRKRAFTTVTSVEGTLQPVTPDGEELISGIYGRTFQFFCDGAIDIRAGDRLKDENGIFYKVSDNGIARRQFNAIDFLKVICEREK